MSESSASLVAISAFLSAHSFHEGPRFL
jgi:hypothetical protein